MMNSMQPSATLARTRLGSASKKMVALLLAAVLFLSLGVAGVLVGKAEEYRLLSDSEPTFARTAATRTYGNLKAYIQEGNKVYYKNASSYEEVTVTTGNNPKYSYFKYGSSGSFSGKADTYLNSNPDRLQYLYVRTSPPTTHVTVKKNWADGIENHLNEIVQFEIKSSTGKILGRGQIPSGSAEITVEVEGEPTNVVETGVFKNGVNQLSDYSSSVEYVTETNGEEPGWKKVDALESGKTYAFVYRSGSSYYALSASGSTLSGSSNGLSSSGIPQSSLPSTSIWKTSENSWVSYGYGQWYLQNTNTNTYLNMGYSGVSLSGYADASFNYSNQTLQNPNGYSGYIFANGTTISKTSTSGTTFTAYEYTEGSLEENSYYLITNTPTAITPTESTYTLSYDANGGSGAPDAVSQTNTDSTKDFTISLERPTREGYDFLGWADSKDAASAQYPPRATISLTGNKTIYAVWKEQEKPVEDPVPEFHKSITPEKQVADNYTIQLNVTGKDKVTTSSSGSTQTSFESVDVLMVIDVTSSMSTTMSDGSTRLAAIQQAATKFVNELSTNKDSNISLITFGTTSNSGNTPIWTNVDWTPLTENTKTSVNNTINSLTLHSDKYSYDTTYAPGLNAAKEQLESGKVPSNNNKKYVIFFSDGDATDSQTTIDTAANAVKAKATVFSIGLPATYWYQSNDKIQSVASDKEKYFEASDTSEMVQAFNKALQTIKEETTISTNKVPLSGVTISDTLSDYVELSDTNASNNYGVTVDGLTQNQYTVTVSGKTVTVQVKDGVTLDDGKTYTVNIPVKPTAEAKDKADAAAADTSTFPSNTDASITYIYDGEPTMKNYAEIPNILVAKTKTYTVTWVNDDGTVLETDTGLKLGDTPEYNGATPTKETESGISYVFDGWDKEISPVTGDTTYTAKFKEVPQTDVILHKTSHAMFVLSALCAVAAGAMFAVEHYRRKRLHE